MTPPRLVSMLGAFVLAFAIPFTVGATVKKEGSWPGVEKKVDLEFDGKPSEGLKRLAKEAGWSLVVTNDVAVDGSDRDVHIDVDEQPADAVLESLFVGRDVVAHRNGNLITVTPRPSASPSAPVATAAAPIPPPVPTVRGEDRNVFGGSLVIHKDEIVHTVTVAGGSLKVEGTVTGDLVVAGGSAKILNGGHVVGNATVFGGSLKVETGGRVDGEVGVAGGSVKREKGAIIGGRVVDDDHAGHSGHVRITIDDDDDTKAELSPAPKASTRSRLSQAVHDFGQSMTKMALLFVLGCVLLALLAAPMEKLRVEVASRPMRSFALGLVGSILGSIAALILVLVLCITVIGIPVALIGVLLAIVTFYGAFAAVLTTFGAAVMGHRTQNPYVHLLLGCGAFLVVSSIPWIGGILMFAVSTIAIGALIATRVGGLFQKNRRAAPPGLV